MGIRVLQVNIRNFRKLKYTFKLIISEHKPDIILLNETGKVDAFQLKIHGYKGFGSNNTDNHGMAIFYKYNMQIEHVTFTDDDLLAIKLITNFGKIIIATAYSPPRIKSLPIIPLNKLFNQSLPILFIGDLNAHSPSFQNSKIADFKGKQLLNIVNNYDLNILGPFFHTFVTARNKGQPDIIISNNSFSLFNHNITQGLDFGSDHVPILFDFQIQPFIVTKPCKENLRSLKIDEYRSQLNTIQVPNLQHKHVSIIDSTVENLMQAITEATTNNCSKFKSLIISQYKPTKEIKDAMTLYQVLSIEHCFFGLHSRIILNEKLDIILELIKKNLTENWNKVVELAFECRKDPLKFWRKYRKLKGEKAPTIKMLKTDVTLDNGQIETIKYTNAQDQAELMSTTWRNIFKENPCHDINNENIKMVDNWYSNFESNLQKEEYINYDNLIPDHPLMRPFSLEEINSVIAKSKNKAPGLSNITYLQLKLTPKNCRQILVVIYDSILCTNHFPQILHKIKMVFIQKPNKDNSNPRNYRPISLLQVILKIFEKTISNRLQYYLEYHNLITERQFGFRSQRNTQHPLLLISELIKSNNKTNRVTLIATRDIEKCFDKIWTRALLLKIQRITNNCTAFTKLIYFFLDARIIIPYFNNSIGSQFKPTAGVAQGSSLGPILFTIFANDHPQNIYADSIISQFADDMVHIVSSDSRYRKGVRLKNRRIKQAQHKLQHELEQTLKWERDWKINSNLNKSNIQCIGTKKDNLIALGGITSGGIQIPISKSVTVLGVNLSGNHIQNNINKAKIALNRLQRFKAAPEKVKSILFKLVFRSILEYPPTVISKSNNKTMRKIQVIQNKGIRFIKNAKLSDRLNMERTHNALKIEPFNIRINKLANKFENKTKDTFFPKPNEVSNVLYKYSEYTITEPPRRKRRKTLFQKLNKNILQHRNHALILNKVVPIDKWKPPPPIYTGQ